MSLPRRVLRGRTYLITRRCTERRFLLKPVPRLNAIVRFVFLHAASLFGIRVHAVTWLGNHWHCVCTDPKEVLPQFMHLVGTLTGRALNAHWGRGESFWAPGSYSAVELLDAESVLDKTVYTIVQAVEAGLVRRPELWPGFHTTAADVGRVLRAAKPDFFFREEGPLPEGASHRIVGPPAFRHLSEAEYRRLLGERVDACLEQIRADRRRAGKTRFLGRRKILAQNPFESAGDVFPDRRLDPRVACRDPELRKSALLALQAWRLDYRECWERWRHGDERARSQLCFPAGTWWMRVAYKVRCGRPPPIGTAA